MSNTTFVWKYILTRLITSTHPAVYQYVMGGHKSKESAVMRITEEAYEWCNPYWMGDDVFNITFVRGVCRQYLKYMELEWKNGNIKIKSIY